MSAFAKLTTVEAKLFSREPMAVFWGLVFPGLLLVVLGLFYPGFLDASADFGGERAIDLYAPIVIGMGLATLGVASLPVYLATYRQQGGLRRLWTTPAHPGLLLTAVLVVHLVTAAAAAALAIGVGVVVFDVPFPQSPVGLLVAFIFAAIALFALGLLIGAIARTASSAQGIGLLVYFPLLFLAGVYFPREVMPDGLRQVSDLSPAGAAVQALRDTWDGAWPSASSLAVMAVFAIGAAFAATRLFRWE
jgi:ABC-2 type transport system permease protein